MRNKDAAQSRDTSELIRWIHTGIEAPALLTVQNHAETDTGTVHSAELVHPDLGVIGRVVTDGDLTMFEPRDNVRFSDEDLTQFLLRSGQDGQAMPTGAHGVHLLLEDVINEACYADAVAQTLGTTQFLVRSYEPRTEDNLGPHRGPVVTRATIPHLRTAREAFVAYLATRPDTQLAPGAQWQMWNGSGWTDLLPAPQLSDSELTARATAMRELARAQGGELNHHEWDNGLYITGTLETNMFTLVADTTPIKFRPLKWCSHDPESVTPVRYEWWNVHTSALVASGTVHGDPRCQRLVTLA